MAHVDSQTVGIGIAAISASVSAFSAYTSRQAVDRSHWPLVWPEIEHRDDEEGRHVLLIRLHNDGSGTAYDVRWSVGSVTLNRRDKVVIDAPLTTDNVSRVIRAIGASENRPAADTDWLERRIPLPDDDIWWVLVRWTDPARVRWELSERGPSSLRSEPRRVRTWRWQLWRPPRDW